MGVWWAGIGSWCIAYPRWSGIVCGGAGIGSWCIAYPRSEVEWYECVVGQV